MPDGNTGIGAAVKRKEDGRFLMGKGRFTDDINRPNQTFAYFLRSSVAHAKINSVDKKKYVEFLETLPTWRLYIILKNSLINA